MPPQVPELLMSLVAQGRWPRDEREALRQNLVSLVPEERVKAFAPEEEWVYLMRPPFKTVADLVENGDRFWLSPLAAPGGLDFEKALLVGHFGLGSDAPIVLDYRAGSPPPRVVYVGARRRKGTRGWRSRRPSPSSSTCSVSERRLHRAGGAAARGTRASHRPRSREGRCPSLRLLA